MGKILLESEVNSIGEMNQQYTPFLLCTKKRATALNCYVTDPSNASDYQLIYGVSKIRTYALYGDTSVTWQDGSYSSIIDIESSKDGSWLQPSVQSSSSFINSVSISQTSSVYGRVLLYYNTSSSQRGSITFIQTESGLTHTVEIYPQQAVHQLLVSVRWMGSTKVFTRSTICTVFLYLMDIDWNHLQLVTIDFANGNQISKLEEGMKAYGLISNSISTSRTISRVRIVVGESLASPFYDHTITLTYPTQSNGALYVSLYNNTIIENPGGHV
jgi:hypothetical protein